MATRVSNEQLEELLEFLTENPSVAKGVGLGIRSKETIDKIWNDLAVRLNSCGSGCTKSGERWKRYWADLKHKSKARLVKRKTEHMGTGGGPCLNSICELDEKVLAIIGEHAVYGDTQHKIPFLKQDPHQNDFEEDELPEITLSHKNESNQQCQSSSQSRCTNVPEPADFHDFIEVELTAGPLLPDIQDSAIRSKSSEDESSIPPNRIQSPAAGPSGISLKRPSIPVCQPRSERPTPPAKINAQPSTPRSARPYPPSNASQSSTSSQPKLRASPAWVIELEKKRVEAEQKLAEAAMIMAEAARHQSEAAAAQIEMNRTLLDIVKQQSRDIRSILEMLRNQPTHENVVQPDHDYDE